MEGIGGRNFVSDRFGATVRRLGLGGLRELSPVGARDVRDLCLARYRREEALA